MSAGMSAGTAQTGGVVSGMPVREIVAALAAFRKANQ